MKYRAAVLPHTKKYINSLSIFYSYNRNLLYQIYTFRCARNVSRKTLKKAKTDISHKEAIIYTESLHNVFFACNIPIDTWCTITL